jgi:hypothetical protein
MVKESGAQRPALESILQRQVLDALLRMGVCCWPHKNIPVPIRRGRTIVGLRRADPILIGLPDIFALVKGKLYGIELKRSHKGYGQTLEQRTWQERLTRNGADYFLAYSLDDVLEKLCLK